ncbi:MAG: hypothetical protein IKE69_00995 [Thermoguttaceae bacterium]|nr:hypothetical protein [Thermoguttaceae bacterium]
MIIDEVLIFTPNFEQRVTKIAYGFLKHGIRTTVFGEEATLLSVFEGYNDGINFIKIPVNEKLKRTPLGTERVSFIREELLKHIKHGQKTLIISRDVLYGYLVGRILADFNKDLFLYITDIADNYDLFYDSFKNPIKRFVFKLGFGYLTRKAVGFSDAIYVVAKINERRMLAVFQKQLISKRIYLLRNLPIKYDLILNTNKIPNTLVYLGKIDEISRDPFYVLEKLVSMPDYAIHFYSDQKERTLDKIRKFAKDNDMEDRVIIHSRVKYADLGKEISKYQIGLVPHKRSLITDYTTPNKIYDYKNAGLVTVMSDCPSLIEENSEFEFGFAYSKIKDDFIEVVRVAQNSPLNTSKVIPIWQEEFDDMYNKIIEDYFADV